MQRKQLEHLIRAAAAVSNEYEIMVIGSQSILGALPQAPTELLQSMEADMFPLRNPKLADVIEGALGEMSAFHDQFGYYAHGVAPETAVLPQGWETRLVRIQNENTDLKIGFCLDPLDLAAAKLAAGREKDFAYIEAMSRYGIIQYPALSDRVDLIPLDAATRLRLQRWVAGRMAQAENIDADGPTL